MAASNYFIGTAAWSIPKDQAPFFPGDDAHLERYARQLNAVEINSSFYRDHRPATYRKWSLMVPEEFRFSVKLAKRFTHERPLEVEGSELEEVLAGIAELGPKLGVILVQLPPKLAFDAGVAEGFFARLRNAYAGAVALEPRHRSWTTPAAVTLLGSHRISKVIADPEPCPLEPSKSNNGVRYFRLHGTPEIYKSNYEPERLESWMIRLREAEAEGATVWCIFDNTTFGHATANALELRRLV